MFALLWISMQTEALLLELIGKVEARKVFFLQILEVLESPLKPLRAGLGLLGGYLRGVGLRVLGTWCLLLLWGSIGIARARSITALLHQLVQTAVTLWRFLSRCTLINITIIIMALHMIIMMTMLALRGPITSIVLPCSLGLGDLETTPATMCLPLVDAVLLNDCSSLVYAGMVIMSWFFFQWNSGSQAWDLSDASTNNILSGCDVVIALVKTCCIHELRGGELL